MTIPENTQRFLTRRPPGTPVGRFTEGFTAPIQGLKFLNQRRHLWRLAVLPILFNLLITGLIIVVLIAIIGWFASVVHPWLTDGVSGGWWVLVLVGEVLAVLMLLAICGVAAVVIWKVLGGVLCGYFYGKLAEEVEDPDLLDDAKVNFGMAVASKNWNDHVGDILQKIEGNTKDL